MLGVESIFRDIQFVQCTTIAKEDDWHTEKHYSRNIWHFTSTLLNNFGERQFVWEVSCVIDYSESISDDWEIRGELYPHRFKFSLPPVNEGYFE